MMKVCNPKENTSLYTIRILWKENIGGERKAFIFRELANIYLCVCLKTKKRRGKMFS
jgi:hypothetical protein